MWEHSVISVFNLTVGQIEAMLDEYGRAGWELVAATRSIVYMKRPKAA